MKIDDTLATVDRLWGEISILVVTHAVAIGALLYADVVPSEVVTANVAPVASLAAISGFRARVQSIGLDLPIVVATAAIVYIVVFQRLSAALLHLPVLKLEYDEPALWRAGKCFAELRQLAVWFSGYTASGKLSDLATTLDLAITGLADTYHEYHDRMVVQPQALANAWSRYYAGFCLLGFVALLGGLLSGSSSHPWMPPFVLFCSALFTRCGWEVQIERSVLSRLRYAINCGIVNGLKRREQPDEDRGQSTSVSGRELHQPLAALQAGLGITPLSELATTTPGDAAQLARDLEIAAELVELPPPGLPYGVWWGLHALRRLRPLHDIGYLPLIHNEVFRGWLFETDPDIRGLAESIDSTQRQQFLSSRNDSHRIREYSHRLDRPRQAPTHSRMDRVLWSYPSLRLALICPRLTLVDSGARYLEARAPERRNRDHKSLPTLEEWRRRRT